MDSVQFGVFFVVLWCLSRQERDGREERGYEIRGFMIQVLFSTVLSYA